MLWRHFFVKKGNQIFFSGSSREKLAFLPIRESDKSLLIIFLQVEVSNRSTEVFVYIFFAYFSRVGAESPAFFRFFLLLSLSEFAFFARIGYTWNSNF